MSRIFRTISIEPTVSELALAFSGLDHEQQADFFEDVAELAAKWDSPACYQWRFIGDHLREDGTSGARNMICELADIIREKP